MTATLQTTRTARLAAAALVVGAISPACEGRGPVLIAHDVVPITPRVTDGIQSVAGGSSDGTSGEHTCATRAGALYCWGAGAHGALGLGDALDHPVPTRVDARRDWIQVVAGSSWTCALDAGGAAYCWGRNASGQLGLGHTADALVPALVGTPNRWTQLAGTVYHACAVRDDGTAWCWGLNEGGQLGQGTDFTEALASTPRQVGIATDWVTVAAGASHSCGVRRPGTLWCWGRNDGGQLGLGRVAAETVATPTQVGTASDWAAVAAGQSHSCGARRDGGVLCWGANDFGQLGLAGDAAVAEPAVVAAGTDWTAVSVNGLGSYALRGTGALWCWGRNTEGQCGVAAAARVPPGPASPEADWRGLAAGRFHACAWKSDQSLWCVGDNAHGEIGDGTTVRPTGWRRVELPP